MIYSALTKASSLTEESQEITTPIHHEPPLFKIKSPPLKGILKRPDQQPSTKATVRIQSRSSSAQSVTDSSAFTNVEFSSPLVDEQHQYMKMNQPVYYEPQHQQSFFLQQQQQQNRQQLY